MKWSVSKIWKAMESIELALCVLCQIWQGSMAHSHPVNLRDAWHLGFWNGMNPMDLYWCLTDNIPNEQVGCSGYD